MTEHSTDHASDDADRDDAGTAPAVNDSEGTPKPDGLGDDGTIPNDPNGIALGHTGTASSFEPEEDEDAEDEHAEDEHAE
jgi:hypothetical protein